MKASIEESGFWIRTSKHSVSWWRPSARWVPLSVRYRRHWYGYVKIR